MSFKDVSQKGQTLTSTRGDLALSVGAAAVLALLVAWPWLGPGYLFGTDWPGQRRLDFPDVISSTAPLEATLAAISALIGGQATGKLLVLAILVGAAASAFHAVPTRNLAARTGAATIFVVNPFVYGRLHYGQLFLLAGYAVLPWVATRLRLLCSDPGWKAGALLGLSLALVGVFTAHLVLEGLVLAALVGVASIVAGVRDRGYVRRLVAAAAGAAGAFAVLSAYWVVPLLIGRGAEARVIAGTGSGAIEGYAALPDPTLGLVPNLLGLYGFWAEGTNRFTSMKVFAPAWPLVLAVLLAVCVVGVVAALRGPNPRLKPYVVGLVVAALVGLYLEMGVSNPLSSDVVRWLDSAFPIYGGMRDAGKWGALLALVYAQLFGLGTAALLDWPRQAGPRALRADWATGTAVGLLVALPLYYGNGLLFGAHGGIKPSDYPGGWYAADRLLAADPHHGRVLFLPWHEYMTFSFIQNDNRVIACPAKTFFSIPVVSNSDPELPGTASPATRDQVAVSDLVRQGRQGKWAQGLAELGINYVLVAREVDWASYAYLDQQPGLVRVADYGSLIVYRTERLSG